VEAARAAYREKEEQVGPETMRLSGEEVRQGRSWPMIERWLRGA